MLLERHRKLCRSAREAQPVRLFSGQQLEEQGPERIHVGPRIHRLAAQELGLA